MSTTPPLEKTEIDSLYAFIYPLAIKAGEILLEGYCSKKEVKLKSAYWDVVTEYDAKIENFLMNEILAIYPSHKFIGEEESEKKLTLNLTDDPTWIIDPIDGTSNFIKNLLHTCVSIALVINKEVVIGIVNNPILKCLYTTKKGEGAFLNGERIHVSDCMEITKANIGYEVSLLHVKNIANKHIKRIYHIGTKATRTVSYGSVVESLCLVARGCLDGYHIEDMYPWDCAAGFLLIKEAGGFVYHTSGGDFQIMRPDLVCGGTESLCQELVKVIKEADSSQSVGDSID